MNRFGTYMARALLLFVGLIVIVAVFKEEYLGQFVGSVTIIFLLCLMGQMGIQVYRFITHKNVAGDKTSINKMKRVKTVATMTGRTNFVEKKGYKSMISKYTEYEITYNVDGKIYRKWIDFSTGVDFGDSFPEGTEVLIYYNSDNPKLLEVIEIL